MKGRQNNVFFLYMNKHKTARRLIIGIITLLGVAGFLFYQRRNFSNYSGPTTSITMALKWVDQGQFAGMYVAKELGYYQQAGIDLSFVDYDPQESAYEKVRTGKADFGLANGTAIVKEHYEGHDLQAIAVFYQHSPYAFISLKGRGITSAWQLQQHRIGIKGTINSENKMIASLLLEKAGLSDDDVTYIYLPVASSEKDDLVTEQADVVGFYRTRIYQFDKEGIPYDVIAPEQYGIVSYNDVLVADPSFLTNNEELTKRFIQATIKGWNYVFEHQEEALDIVMSYIEEPAYADREYQRSIIKNSQPLIKPSKNFPIGKMEPKQWELLVESVADDVGQISISIDDMVSFEYLP